MLVRTVNVFGTDCLRIDSSDRKAGASRGLGKAIGLRSSLIEPMLERRDGRCKMSLNMTENLSRGSGITRSGMKSGRTCNPNGKNGLSIIHGLFAYTASLGGGFGRPASSLLADLVR